MDAVGVRRLDSAGPLNLEGLENGVLDAGVPAGVLNAGGGEGLGLGDAVVEVELAAAEGLDALAPSEVTPVAVMQWIALKFLFSFY